MVPSSSAEISPEYKRLVIYGMKGGQVQSKIRDRVRRFVQIYVDTYHLRFCPVCVSDVLACETLFNSSTEAQRRIYEVCEHTNILKASLNSAICSAVRDSAYDQSQHDGSLIGPSSCFETHEAYSTENLPSL